MLNSDIELKELKKAAEIRKLKETLPMMIRGCEHSLDKLESPVVVNPGGMLTHNKVVKDIYTNLEKALNHAEAGTIHDVEHMADKISKAEMYARDIGLDISKNTRIIAELGYRNGVEYALEKARLFATVNDKIFMSLLLNAITYAREVEARDSDAKEHHYARGIEIEAGKIKKQGYTNIIETYLNKAIALTDSDGPRPAEHCLDLVVCYAKGIGVDVSDKVKAMKSLIREICE